MNQTCSLFGPGDHETKQCNAVITVKRVSGTLSLLGCVLMLMMIVLYKKHTTFIQRIIIHMTVAALFSAVGYIMGDDQQEGPFCEFQGFFTNFSDWSVLMWMFSITIVMFIYITKSKTISIKEQWIFYVVCWGVPLVISLIPFAQHRYGPAGAWCWIRHERGDNPANASELLWRFMIWYVPLFALLIIMMGMYIAMVYTAHKKTKTFTGTHNAETDMRNSQLLDEIKPLRAYPFIYLILNIFPLVNRIQNSVNQDHSVFWLVLFHVICTPLVGFVNALVFGLNRENIQQLKWENFRHACMNFWRFKKTEIGEYQAQRNDDCERLSISGNENVHQ